MSLSRIITNGNNSLVGHVNFVDCSFDNIDCNTITAGTGIFNTLIAATAIFQTSLNVTDPIISMGVGNGTVGDSKNEGFTVEYKNTVPNWGGMLRSATTKEWYVYQNATPQPDESTDLTTLAQANLNVASGTFGNILCNNNILSSYIQSSNLAAGTGVFTNVIATNTTITNAQVASLVAGTGTIGGVLINNGTVNAGTGIFTNLIESTLTAGTGTFITVNAGTGNITTLNSTTILNSGSGTFTTLNAGTGIFPTNIAAQAVGTDIAGWYNFVLADANKLFYVTANSGATLTIPANASIAYPVGTELTAVQYGTGLVTWAITSDTLNSAGSVKTIAQQYTAAVAKKRAATEWWVNGALTAP